MTADSISCRQTLDVYVASCRKMFCHPRCMAVERETTGNRTVFTSNSVYISSSPVTVVTSCLTSANQIQGGFLADACVGSRDDHGLAIQPCVGSALPMKHVACLRRTQYKISLYRTVKINGALDPALLITSVLRHPVDLSCEMILLPFVGHPPLFSPKSLFFYFF